MRKPRADGQRNRERLIAAAKAGFAETGVDVSLEEIARRAEVGIGTLYRHFPNRDAVVEAVYRRELEQLAEAAARLSATLAPADALHRWMDVFIDYIATKKVIAPALSALMAGGGDLYATAGVRIIEAMTGLVARAKAAGEIRQDADAEDLVRALVGFAYSTVGPAWEASSRRLIDILMDGLRVR